MTTFMQTQKIMNNTSYRFDFGGPMQVWGVALNGFQFSYGNDTDQHNVGQLSCRLMITPASGSGVSSEASVQVSMVMGRSGNYIQDDSLTFAIVTMLYSDTDNDLVVQNVPYGTSVAAPATPGDAAWAIAGFSVGNIATDEVAVSSFSCSADGTISSGNVLTSNGIVTLPGVSGSGGQTVDVLMIGTAQARPQTFFIDTLTATPSNDNYYGLPINGNTGGPNNTPQTYTPPAALVGGAQIGMITFLLQDFSMAMGGDSAEVEFVRAGCLVLTPPSVDGGAYAFGNVQVPDTCTAQSLIPTSQQNITVNSDFIMFRPADGFNAAEQTTDTSGTFLVVGTLVPSS